MSLSRLILFLKLGLSKFKKLATDFRGWLKQPSRTEIMAFQIMESHTEQTRALVETVQLLAEAQTKQAEAFQRQLQVIVDIWNQPVPNREDPIRSARETQLMRDLQREAEAGDYLARELQKPENKAQLEEYLDLFRES